jgi:UDP-4-amino-4,6-dideoxy-N-acetyl-beta-L-altrosamine N-acetyltransferase
MHDPSTSNDRVRPMSEADLEFVLSWRNHPQVRRHMFTRHVIDLDEHRAWFMRSVADPRRQLLIYERDGLPCGFVSLIQGIHPNVADWGFYAAPDAPAGTGRGMGRAALDHAFGLLGLHKVCGQALETNQQSISFHLALGFHEEGRLREQHFDGQRYQAVICFGLLASEWARGHKGTAT